MENEEVQKLLDKVLTLTPIEKNNFYHTLLTIIRKNTDPSKSTRDIIMEFDELLEQKRAKLDGILNGDSSSSSSPAKSSPIFRRVQ